MQAGSVLCLGETFLAASPGRAHDAAASQVACGSSVG